MSVGITPRGNVVSATASHYTSRLNDPRGFSVNNIHSVPRSLERNGISSFEKIYIEEINTLCDGKEEGENITARNLISTNVDFSDSLPEIRGKDLGQNSGIPLPPFISSYFNSILDDLQEKVVSLESILRRHASPKKLSKSFENSSSNTSSSFIDSFFDSDVPTLRNSFRFEEEGSNNSVKTEPASRTSSLGIEKNNCSGETNNSNNSPFKSSSPIEKEISAEALLDQLLGDDVVTTNSNVKKDLNLSEIDESEDDEDDDFLPNSTRLGRQNDKLSEFLDELLDNDDKVKKSSQPKTTDPNTFILSPTDSFSSMQTEEVVSLICSGVKESNSKNIEEDDSLISLTDDKSSNKSITITIEKKHIVLSMQNCAEALFQLCDIMSTRIKGIQEEIDNYYIKCSDFVSNFDLPAKQMQLNETVKRLCSHTDRLNTTKKLLQQEKWRLQIILGSPYVDKIYTNEQDISELVKIEKSQLYGSTNKNILSPLCICHTAAPLKESYQLACEVLSHRRQLSRLVEIFRACPEAIEQWGSLLQEEANTKCYDALEYIFKESEKEKEKLMHAFEIILKEDL